MSFKIQLAFAQIRPLRQRNILKTQLHMTLIYKIYLETKGNKIISYVNQCNYFLLFCFFLHLEIIVLQQYLYASFNGCMYINNKRFILQVHRCSYLFTIYSNVLSVLTLFRPCWYRLYLRPGGVALRPKSSINEEENMTSRLL